MADNTNIAIGSPKFHITNVLALTLITGIMTFLLLFVYFVTYIEVDPTQEVVEMLGDEVDNYVITQQNLKKSDLDNLFVKDRSRMTSYFSTDEILQFLVTDKNTGDLVMKVYAVGSGGFGGTVAALVAVDGVKVRAYKVINAASETAGLGQRVAERAFQRQFIGKTKDQLPTSRVDWLPKNIDMISGATLSSTAIVNNIFKAFDLYTIGGQNG